MTRRNREIIRRHRLNPLLTAADWPYPCSSRFNPAAPLLPDSTVYRLARADDRPGLQKIFTPFTAGGIF